MDFDEFRAKYDSFEVPRFDLQVGSETIQERDGVVSYLVVETVLDGADRFSVTLAYPFDPESREFEGIDWERFAPDTDVRVSMGYGDERELLFNGTITTIRTSFDADSVPTIEVSGYGPLYAMMRETKSRSWDEKTDSDVIGDVASAYAFRQVTVEETELVHQKIVQDRENDYRFLSERADRYGYELFARLDTLFFRAPRYRSDPVVTLRYGESFTSFAPEINAADQVGAIEVRHWDPATKEELIGSATANGGGEGVTVYRIPVRSVDEANRLAEAALSRTAEGLVRGRGETVGVPEIRAGETIHIGDVSEHLSRNYYVERATHRFGDSGYTTTFEVSERAL